MSKPWAPVLTQHLELLSATDLTAIEQYSLESLKQRKGAWSLEDAARSWTEGVLYILLLKGHLRPVEALKAERACAACKSKPETAT